MPKKMAVLAAVLAAVLSVTTPALAQVQDEAPACEFHDACLDTSEEQQAANEQEVASSGLTVPPVPGIGCENLPADQETPAPVPDPECDNVDQSLEVAPSSNDSQEVNTAGNLQSASAAQYGVSPACAPCAQAVLTAAKEAITEDVSDGGTNPKETFGAALDAARDTEGTREAAASEEAGAPVEDTAAYQAAFEAAKEAGADDETAQEAAEQAVADLLPDEAASSAGGSATGKANKASKVRKGGSGEGKTRKERASKADDGKGKDRKDKARNDDASEEEATDEEVATSGENGGAGGGDGPTTPAGSGAPLLLGGVALLSVGGYTGLRFARSWPSVPGRRLLRN